MKQHAATTAKAKYFTSSGLSAKSGGAQDEVFPPWIFSTHSLTFACSSLSALVWVGGHIITARSKELLTDRKVSSSTPFINQLLATSPNAEHVLRKRVCGASVCERVQREYGANKAKYLQMSDVYNNTCFRVYNNTCFRVFFSLSGNSTPSF